MNAEKIEQLVQKVVDEVMRKIQLDERRSKSLVAISLGEQEKIPNNFFETLQSTLTFAEELEASDLILVTELSFEQLTALSNLQAIDKLTQVMIEGLFKKQSILVLSTNMSLEVLRKQTRYGVWKQLNETIQKLESFGIYFIQSEEMLNTLLQQENLRKKRQSTTAIVR